VAPTILALLGEEVPETMEGDVLIASEPVS